MVSAYPGWEQRDAGAGPRRPWQSDGLAGGGIVGWWDGGGEIDFLSRSLLLNPLKMRETEDCFILIKKVRWRCEKE